MATVPTTEQTVFPEQGPLPQANGADFGAQIGAAQQGLGNQVSQVGDEAFDQAIKWQGLKNQATAQDLDVQFQGDLGKLEDGYYSLKGKAAADAYPQFQSDLTALRDKYVGAAPNPMVQNMIGQSVNYSLGRSLRSGGQFAGEQTRAWMVDSGTARIQSLDYAATKRFSDQGYADETDKARDAAIEDQGKIQGWSDEHIALAKQQARDKLLEDRQKAAQDYLKGQPVADVLHSLVGTSGAGAQNGPVGGADYRKNVVATEFGSGQNDPKNPHQGLVQADDAWWAHFGAGGDRNNMKDALAALDRETAENQPKLEAALGRKATDADLYLAHQQGLAGAVALLSHPDQPASQSVPVANIAANLPAGSGDANTITGAQFSNIWAKGFDQSGGIMANNPASHNNQLDAAIATLSDAQKMELTKSTIDAWHTQDAAVRAQTEFQQTQQAKAEKQQYDDVKSQGQAVIAANWANPGKNPPLDIAKFSQTPYAQTHPELVTAMIDYRKALASPPDKTIDNATTQQLYRGFLNGTATTKDFQDAFAPPDSTPGKISKENLDFLMNVAKTDGDGDATQKALKAKFLSTAEEGIKGAPVDGSTSGDAQYRFDYDFQQAWDAKIKAGEDPKGLITPGSKDYFGSLANLSHYSQTAADALAEQADAQNPGLVSRTLTAIGNAFSGDSGPAVPPELPKGTTYAGKTKDGRDAYRLPDGTLRAEGAPVAPAAPAAPAPAPVAVAGPTVPSGE